MSDDDTARRVAVQHRIAWVADRSRDNFERLDDEGRTSTIVDIALDVGAAMKSDAAYEHMLMALGAHVLLWLEHEAEIEAR